MSPRDSAAGRTLREKAQGAKAPKIAEALEALDPDLLEWTEGFVFGQVWTRPGLDFERRMLVAISALGSLGQIAQLRAYLHGALQAGVPEEAIGETLAMLTVYAGFPAAVNALECWREVRATQLRHDPAE
jgi:4-carboxymuconolactone decarboxylase